MSSPQEDKSDTMETPTPAGPPAIVSVSGPLMPPDQATWGAGEGLTVRYSGRSAVGLVREHNEDNFLIANLTTGDRGAREGGAVRDIAHTDVVGGGGLLFAVCDGMGGAAAGEVASQMAVDVLQEAMQRGGFPRERDVLARRLVAAVEEAGRRIFDAAQKERSRRGMGTTATAAVLIDKVLFLAEVGDSRAYLLRGGALKQVTKDQSLVNQLIEAGHLTEAEAEAFEHSNIILQALGTAETVQVDLTFVELRRGDRLMLCSDGLSGLVSTETLREVLANIDDPAECTATLIKFAEAGGGHDNITVVVIDFQGDALELPSETDSFGYLQYPLVPESGVAGTFSEEEVTETAKPSARANYESFPAYEPVSVAVGPDSNPWLWISAGLAALLLGAWLLAAGSSGSVTATNEPIPSERAVAPAEQPADKPEEFARNRNNAIPVRVFSDVQDAVLFVNGEDRGRLQGGHEARTVELPPGQYRFEAQSHGNVAAVEWVTVQDSAQVDVHLRVPTGTQEPVRPAAPDSPPPGSGTAPKPAGAATEPAPNAEPSRPTAPAAAPDAKQRSAAVASAPVAREPQPKAAAPSDATTKPKSKPQSTASTKPKTEPAGASPEGAAARPPEAPRTPEAPAKTAEGIPANPF